MAGLHRRRGRALSRSPLLMALFCIRYGMNQIVIGIARRLASKA